ncbi:MAG TPA: DUF6174 domain-containing protein [Pirellulales bacterium]|nr:DUF6174 domain-containing protein [Pirellulales bacterium]
MNADARPARRGGWRGFWIGAVAGLALMLLVALPATQWLRGGGRPRLTQAAYDEAGRRWDERGPKNYNLDVAVTGNRPSQIHVEVRDAQAVHLVRDGREPQQRRTWYYWTVPGMLDTVGLELEKVDDAAAGFSAPPGSQVILRAEFDPTYGYPASYSRVVAGQNLDMGWTVTRFEVVAPEQTAE